MVVLMSDVLADFSASLLAAGGFSESDARQVADQLVWANLRGTDSHGVLRIPRYIEMLEQGLIISGAPIAQAAGQGSIAVLECGKAPGTIGMLAAVDRASALARELGLGWCAARSIGHAGAVGYFTSKLAQQGLVGIAMTASKPLMSYFGAKGEALSTNPLSIAVPVAGADPIVFDMSTAAVALGKVMAAKDAGTSIPLGWAIDATGTETTDPHCVAALLPMAGPKGSGLSLMIEILTSVLIGNSIIGPALLRGDGAGGNGLVIAVNPACFGAQNVFDAGVEQLRGAIHALEPASGTEAVLLPGERGELTARTRAFDGIPLAAGTCKRLVDLALRLGVTVPPVLA